MNDSLLWGKTTQFFYSLSPEVIDSAFKQIGLRACGRVLPLNSLENRVYDVEVDRDGEEINLVVKFYRPGRWAKEAILEEHQFLQELKELEIPVVAPLEFDGKTLLQEDSTGLYYALFPKVRGRLKDELNSEEKEQIGRLVGRIHNVGSLSAFKYRAAFHPKNYIDTNLDYLEEVGDELNLPMPTLKNYLTLGREISRLVNQFYGNLPLIRIHGDLHRGNILWTPKDGPYLVDFDDCLMGPREQDLWPLFPARDKYAEEDREQFLLAYSSISREKMEFINPTLVEAMRSMRMINFCGWIARRWSDPAFKHAFSAFDSIHYWEGEVLSLREQLALLSIPSSF